MTTLAPPEIKQLTIKHIASLPPSGNCDGCPRCQDIENAGYCKVKHPKFAPYHPICKVCGHCVLRGSHKDDAEDVR